MEVFAKLPNPIAGPAYYTTASEVATREFVGIAILQKCVLKSDLDTTSCVTSYVFPLLEFWLGPLTGTIRLAPSIF